MDLIVCPVCKNIKVEFKFKVSKLTSDTFYIYTCKQCTTEFVWPRPSIDDIKYYYDTKRISKKEESIATYKESISKLSYGGTKEAKFLLSKIKKLIPPPAKLADVACGNGHHLKVALNLGYDILGIEISNSALEICKKVQGVDNKKLIYASFEEIEGLEIESFDVIIMSQVLEHVIDPNIWINKAYKLLRNDGVLCIAVPNHASIESKILRKKYGFYCPPEHINFFKPQSFIKIAENKKFEIFKMFSRNFFAISEYINNSVINGAIFSINWIIDKLLWNLNGRYLYILMVKK